MSSQKQRLPTNIILRKLKSDEHVKVSGVLKRVELPARHTLYDRNITSRRAYFPIDCIISIRIALMDGASAEIGMIGHEGLVGLPLILGRTFSHGQAIVQHPGSAWEIDGVALMNLFLDREHMPGLQRSLLQFAQAFVAQTSITGICNRFHTLDQQLARWILMTIDRLPHPESFHATQTSISEALGVRHASINEAAQKLRKAKCIEYGDRAKGGTIVVTNRQVLERRTCECYRSLRAEYEDVLTPPPP